MTSDQYPPSGDTPELPTTPPRPVLEAVEKPEAPAPALELNELGAAVLEGITTEFGRYLEGTARDIETNLRTVAVLVASAIAEDLGPEELQRLKNTATTIITRRQVNFRSGLRDQMREGLTKAIGVAVAVGAGALRSTG